jgi:syntaxin 16
MLQVKHNVQRTLAIELQKLSVQFRKQQKSYLNKIRQQGAAGTSSNFWALDDERSGQKASEDYDPGFSDVQVLSA